MGRAKKLTISLFDLFGHEYFLGFIALTTDINAGWHIVAADTPALQIVIFDGGIAVVVKLDCID